MPCVNSNGQPVPGIQGQCPIGSTWRHPNGAEIEASKVYDLPAGSYGREDEGTSTGELTPGWFGRNRMSDEDIQLNWESMANRKPLMDRPDWMPDWGADAGIIAAGVLGGGRNPGSKKSMIEAMKNMGIRLKDSKLMDKLFKTNKKQYNKDGSPKNVPGDPIYKNVRPNWNAKLKQWEFRGKKINPQTWNGGKGVNSTQRVRVGTNPKLDPKGNPIPVTARDWSKWKIGAGAAIPSYAGIQALMNQFGGGEAEENINKNALENQRLMENEAYGGPRGEDWSFVPKQKEAEPTAMEKFGKNIKDPKWWMESMSGDKTDTRLMRLGQLMDYYGRTPKQRAAVDMPSKVWAANAAAAAKGSASSYTALKNMILSPAEITKQIYIDGGGILGFGGMDEDEKKAAAQTRGNAINALMHELAMMGQLPTMANAQALYKIKNPDTESTKPDEDEEKSWWDFTST
jgi:hypothetical protein